MSQCFMCKYSRGVVNFTLGPIFVLAATGERAISPETQNTGKNINCYHQIYRNWAKSI